jgi:hypothetical protein
VAEWWRGRSDRRETVLRGLLVEPPTDEVVELAGAALGRVLLGTVSDVCRRARMVGPLSVARKAMRASASPTALL